MPADTTPDSPQNPLDAYVALLKSKGAPTKEVNLRKHFLRHLVSVLQGKPLDGDVYREVVDKVARKFPDDDLSQQTFKTAAREFYNFWIGDVKSLAKLNSANLFDPEPIYIKINGNLTDLLGQMDADREWQCADAPSIERYLAQLYAGGLAQAAIDVRERLLTLLMYVSRQHGASPKVYRAAVDALLPLFTTPEGQQVFVSLAREFYYFWIQDPAAQVAGAVPGDMDGNRQLVF